jgi:hypothetical protein
MNAERNDKDAMKALRTARHSVVQEAREKIKTQHRDIKQIKDQLRSGGKTVPQIAHATEIDTDLVLRYVSGLRKYGELIEGPKADGYFTYALAD